jgi:hypothetical protein
MRRALAIALLLVAPLSARDRVAVTVPAFTPTVCKDNRCGATLRVRVRVDPDDANRALRVEADGAMFRSSQFDLHGADDRATWTIEWRELPAGDYRITARVGRSDGSVWTATADAHLVGF